MLSFFLNLSAITSKQADSVLKEAIYFLSNGSESKYI
jgi:hypothetical protein